MICMGDETGAGKADHELLVHIQFDVGDLGDNFPASLPRLPVKQDRLGAGQGTIAQRLVNSKLQVGQHTQDNGLPGGDMLAKGAGHIYPVQIFKGHPHLVCYGCKNGIHGGLGAHQGVNIHLAEQHRLSLVTLLSRYHYIGQAVILLNKAAGRLGLVFPELAPYVNDSGQVEPGNQKDVPRVEVTPEEMAARMRVAATGSNQ